MGITPRVQSPAPAPHVAPRSATPAVLVRTTVLTRIEAGKQVRAEGFLEQAERMLRACEQTPLPTQRPAATPHRTPHPVRPVAPPIRRRGKTARDRANRFARGGR